MRILAVIAVSLFAAASAVAQVAEPAPTTPVDTSALPVIKPEALRLEPYAAGLFKGVMETRRIPGAVFVAVKNGEVLFAKGYGYANVEAGTSIDPETTQFRVASVSKLITATAVMQLVEAGRLKLDADVNDVLQAFKIPEAFGKPVTLANLLTHTGGFDDQFKGGSAPLDAADVALGDYLAHMMPPRVMPPGETMSYSNHGLALAGYLVETASGQDFRAYVQDRIFNPLGMRHSRFGVTNPAPSTIATPYTDRDGMLTARNFDRMWMYPAGDLLTTGSDMARFMLAHLGRGKFGGARILAPETADVMHATQFRNGEGLDGWAYGFQERTLNGWRTIQHGGDWRGFGALLVLVPEAGIGFFVATNKDNDPVFFDTVEKGLADFFLPPRAELRRPAPTLDALSPKAAEVAGLYIPNRHMRHDYMKLGLFFMSARLSAGPGETLILERGAASRGNVVFKPVRDGLWYSSERQRHLLAFKDASGQVTRVALDFWVLDRPGFSENAPIHGWLAGVAIAFGALAFLGYAVYGPLMRLAGLRGASPVPAHARVVASLLGLTVVVFFALTFGTLASVDPQDILVETPALLNVGVWIPALIAVLGAATVLLALRTLASDGPLLVRLGPWFAVAAGALAIVFAWIWNIVPWGI